MKSLIFKISVNIYVLMTPNFCFHASEPCIQLPIQHLCLNVYRHLKCNTSNIELIVFLYPVLVTLMTSTRVHTHTHARTHKLEAWESSKLSPSLILIFNHHVSSVLLAALSWFVRFPPLLDINGKGVICHKLEIVQNAPSY